MTALSAMASRPIRVPNADVACAPHRCRNPRCCQREVIFPLPQDQNFLPQFGGGEYGSKSRARLRPRLGFRPQDVTVVGVVEAAVLEIALAEHTADQDQGGAGDLG